MRGLRSRLIHEVSKSAWKKVLTLRLERLRLENGEVGERKRFVGKTNYVLSHNWRVTPLMAFTLDLEPFPYYLSFGVTS
jgi:hypothetical protein